MNAKSLVFFGLMALFFSYTSVFALDLAESSDFDNDSLGDIVYYNPSTGVFSIRGSSTGGFTQVSLGSIGDIPSLGDFDGDGRADLATFNRTVGSWNILLQGAASATSDSFGNIGDIPVSSSYSNESCTDLATYNVKTGVFNIRSCQTNIERTVSVGPIGALPAPADFDCDGIIDPATYFPNERRWNIRRSTDNQLQSFVYGLWFDQPIPSDFEGLGCAQAALYRPLGKFFIHSDSVQSRGSSPQVANIQQWGLSEDRFALVNADGDSATDYSVTRSTTGSNFLLTSLNFFFPVSIGAENGVISNTISPPFLGGRPSFSSENVPVSATTLLHPLYNVEGDYNRDGRADFAIASVDRNSGTTQFTVSLNTGQDMQMQVNAPGDALVPADYNGDGRTQAAVVFVNSNTDLQWHILNPDGSEDVQLFGVNGDRPIAGDFDCDGKADKAVIREVNGFLLWDIDVSSNDSVVLTRNFGLVGDKPYVADVNGDLCDELVVSREIGGGLTWFHQRLEDGTSAGPIRLETVNWGLVGDEGLTPNDIDGDRRADFIVSRPSPSGLIETYVRRSTEGDNPAPVADGFGLHCDVVAPGQYDGLNFSRLGVFRRDQSTFFVERFFGDVDTVSLISGSQVLIRPDGTVVQNNGEGQVAPAGVTCSGASVSPPQTPGGGAIPPAGGGLGFNPPCSTLGFNDGRGGDLWLPFSEANGRPVYLLNNGWQAGAVVDAELIDGSFERARFTGFHNPDAGILRPHFRFDNTCFSMTGRFIVQDAGQICETSVPDVCNRTD